MVYPLLSILIATRNRQETASIVISEILKLNLSNVELVVSDTSDKTNLLELVSLRADISTNQVNFKYQHTSAALSMTENYSKTIDMASGEYICMIGDDDFIHPNIVEVLKFAKENDLDSVTQSIGYGFNWVDEQSGILGGWYTENRSIEIRKTGKALDKILLKGGVMTIDAPRLYHGIVRKKIFDSLKYKHGHYFFGTSPDISASVSICNLSTTYGLSFFQFTIPGASLKSNSNIGLRRLAPHINTSDHVRLHTDVIWPNFIPPLLCAETNWPEAVYKTLSVLKSEKLKDINLAYCYLLMYSKYWYQRDYITPAMLNFLKRLTLIQLLLMPLKLMLIIFYISMQKIKRKISSKDFKVKVAATMDSIIANTK